MAIVSYEYRVNGGVAVNMGMPPIVSGQRQYSVTGLTAGTNYTFEERSVNTEGKRSPWSVIRSASTFSPLLDQLGLTTFAAFGMRKLRTAYAGPGFRAVRASDSAEQDIAFSGTSLNWASAIAFKGASTINAKTFYDQSGNARDITDLTSAPLQPLIDTTLKILDFNGANNTLLRSSTDLSSTDKVTMIWCGCVDDPTGGPYIAGFTDGGGTNLAFIELTSQQYGAVQTVGGNTGNKRVVTGVDTSFHVVSMVVDRSLATGLETKLFIDGVEQTTTDNATNLSGVFNAANYFGLASFAGSAPGNNKTFEWLVFPSALSDANRIIAEKSMGDFYGRSYPIICDGDSQTALSGASWVEQLIPQYTDHLHYFVDLAIIGQTNETMLANFASKIAPLYRPNVSKQVFILPGGINDLLAGGTAFTNLQANAQAYGNAVHALGSNAKFIITPIPPCGLVSAGGSLPDAREPTRVAYNAFALAGVGTWADAFCPWESDSRLTNPADTTYFSGDKLHYNGAGQLIRANIMKTTIDSLIP